MPDYLKIQSSDAFKWLICALLSMIIYLAKGIYDDVGVLKTDMVEVKTTLKLQNQKPEPNPITMRVE